MTRPVAIISALPQELAALSAAVSAPSRSTWRGRQVILGKIDGCRVVLFQGDIGKVNTAMTATVAVERYEAGGLVFSGVAGSLSPELGIGDVVIGERVIQHDAGTLEDGGLRRYQPGHIPAFNPTDRFGYRPSAGVLSDALDAARGLDLDPVLGRKPRITAGTILTGDQYLQDEGIRDRLRGDPGGVAVDMESGALGQAAEVLGVDHLVIRSISDLAGRGAIDDFLAFLSQVSANSARVVRHLLPVISSTWTA